MGTEIERLQMLVDRYQRLCQGYQSHLAQLEQDIKGYRMEIAKLKHDVDTVCSQDADGYMTVKQAARFLGISVGTVYNYVKKGHYTIHRLPGGRTRLARAELTPAPEKRTA